MKKQHPIIAKCLLHISSFGLFTSQDYFSHILPLKQNLLTNQGKEVVLIMTSGGFCYINTYFIYLFMNCQRNHSNFIFFRGLHVCFICFFFNVLLCSSLFGLFVEINCSVVLGHLWFYLFFYYSV